MKDSLDFSDPKNMTGIGIAVIFVLFMVSLLVFIFIGTMNGSIYAVSEPTFNSMSIVAMTSGDSFVSAVNDSSVLLGHDRLYGSTFVVVLN